MADGLSALKAGLRGWARRPGFVAAAWISLVLGLGTNTAIFTLLDAVFLRPLPVEAPERLVALGNSIEEESGEYTGFRSFSWANFDDLRAAETRSLDGVAAYFWGEMSLAGGDRPERVTGMWVSGGYFDVLGVPSAAGRLLASTDENRDRTPVAVLSHGCWTRLFGADPAIVGRAVTVNGESVDVVGVAPRGFRGTEVGIDVDIFLPAVPMFERTSPYAQYFAVRGVAIFRAFARLAEGATVAQADQELQLFMQRMAEEYPDNEGLGGAARPLLEETMPGGGRETYFGYARVILVPTALLLFIACLNVVNLLLVRGAERSREIALRQALGAGRGRVTRQLVVENLLLFLVGGLLSLPVARWSLDLLWSLRPPRFAESAVNLELDLVVWAFTLAVALLVGLLFGILPAWSASRVDLVADLKEGSDPGGRGGRLRPRHLLVAAQIALALVALVGAGLLWKVLEQAREIDLGFTADQIAVLTIAPGDQGYDDATTRQFYRRAVETATAVPGARAAVVAANRLLRGSTLQRQIFLPGASEKEWVTYGARNAHRVNMVGPGFFDVAGIPLLAGRDFRVDEVTEPTKEPTAETIDETTSETTNETTAEPRQVAVINRAMAESLWPDQDPIGRVFHFDSPSRPPVEVIGVVEDARYRHVREEQELFVYVPIGQEGYVPPAMTLHVRSEIEPAALLPTLRREIQALDPNLPLADVTALSDFVSEDLWIERSTARLMALCGLLALILAVVGVYGVMSYSVRRRRRELAVRTALGAGRADVARTVLAEAARVVLLGAVVGLALTWWITRTVIADLLHGLSPFDPASWIGMTALLAVAALLGTLIPTRRAMRVEPMQALREE